MNTMSIELPMLTIAKQLELSFIAEGQSCSDFYVTNELLDSGSADILCSSSVYFTFSDPEQTSIALTNMYLYLDNYNNKYYADYVEHLSLDPPPTENYFYGDHNKWTVLFYKIQMEVKEHYDTVGVCTGAIIPVNTCSFSNITYS